MAKIYVPGVLFSSLLIVIHFSSSPGFATQRPDHGSGKLSPRSGSGFFPLSEDTSQIISSDGLGTLVLKGKIVEQARLDNSLDADKEEKNN